MTMNFKDTYKTMNDNIHGDKALMHMIMNGDAPKKESKFFFKFKPVYSVAIAAVFIICAVTLYHNTGLDKHTATIEYSESLPAQENDNSGREDKAANQKASEDNAVAEGEMGYGEASQSTESDDAFEGVNAEASTESRQSDDAPSYATDISADGAEGNEAALSKDASDYDSYSVPAPASVYDSEDSADISTPASGSSSGGGSHDESVARRSADENTSRAGGGSSAGQKFRGLQDETEDEGKSQKSKEYEFKTTCSNIASAAKLPTDMTASGAPVMNRNDDDTVDNITISYKGEDGRSVDFVFTKDQESTNSAMRATSYGDVTVMVSANGLDDEEVNELMRSVTKP